MVFSICGWVVIGLTLALNAGRTPPSKEPPSGVSGSLVPATTLSNPLSFTRRSTVGHLVS
jgi:hypothetical protein